MRRRFTIIEGGATQVRPIEERQAADDGPVSWTIECVRPGAVSAERIAAWRGLLTRLRVSEPVYADPDYLLTAAQHQARGADPVFVFALSDVGGLQRLEGVLPLSTSRNLWGRGSARIWHPDGLRLEPSINPACATDLLAALGDDLRRRGIRVGSDLLTEPLGASPSARGVAPMRLARSAARPRRDIPARNLVGIRAAQMPMRERSRAERIADPELIRDAVEEFLGLDARASPDPIIADPSQAAMVRVVTRLFARRRQIVVDLVRRDDLVVAATLRLGDGAGSVVWRQVQDDAAEGGEHGLPDRQTG